MFFADGQKVDEILGAVPEHAIRTMVESILKDFPTDGRGRLKVLLTSWVEHNKQHSEKFRKWAEKARDIEDNPIYNSILQATQEMEKTSERLSQLLVELQGYGN
jgi:thioredoxin-like negative regulator of GroEL